MGRPASGSSVVIQSAGATGTGHYLYQLIDPAATTGIAVQSASFSEAHAEDNNTALGATYLSYGNLRGSWSIDYSGRFPKTTRKMGHTGLITVGSGTAYVSRSESFSLAFDWGEQDVTPLDSDGIIANSHDWMFYRPKRLVKVSGSWQGIRDQSVTESAVYKQGDTVPGMTFRLSDETTDNTVALSVVTIERTWSASAPEDGKQVYGYSFVATGAIVVGGGTASILTAGTLGEQVMDDSGGVPSEEIVLAAHAGENLYTGNAYLQTMNISCPATGPIIVSGKIRGTGIIDSTDS